MTLTLSTTTWTPAADRADLTRAAVAAAIPDLTWAEEPDPDAIRLADALGLGLPEVTRTAVGATVAGCDLIGVEAIDLGGRTRVLAVVDAVDVLLVVAVEFTPYP